MPTLRSVADWTGREVNGVVLGEPVTDIATGEFAWSHASIPGGFIDTNGDIWLEVDDAESIP